MIRPAFALAVLTLLFHKVNAQQPRSALYDFVTGRSINKPAVAVTQLFTVPAGTAVENSNSSVTQSHLLIINRATTAAIVKNKPALVSVSIPAGVHTYTLQLAEQDISMDGLYVYTLAGTGNPVKQGMLNAVHYRGYVEGYPSSIASMSVFENGETMILFSNEEGNFNLGKTAASDTYILYNSANMQSPPSFHCSTGKLPVIGSDAIQQRPADPVLPQGVVPATLCKKVRFVWEASYKLYSNNFNSNLVNTVNYIAGLFNQVATMYANEGITTELNNTYIWTSQDPYNTSTAGNALATLQSRYNGLGNNFNGDLCMLLDGAPTNNGGIAYILDFDQCNRAYAYGYVNVYGTYNTVPAYSWDVEGTTHEAGHLMGSYHTQWCGWNTGAGGSCGAIDNCYPVDPSITCNTCSAMVNTNPTAPAGFMGTVMSYCYLRNGIGVNLSYGFGQLPQARIRNCINAATCFIPDSKWTGAASTAWENTGNWSCGNVPDANTDVTISNGLSNYPVVNSAATCRKLRTGTNTSVTVRTGFSLRVTGTGN